jgi:hypothetical protein
MEDNDSLPSGDEDKSEEEQEKEVKVVPKKDKKKKKSPKPEAEPMEEEEEAKEEKGRCANPVSYGKRNPNTGCLEIKFKQSNFRWMCIDSVGADQKLFIFLVCFAYKFFNGNLHLHNSAKIRSHKEVTKR